MTRRIKTHKRILPLILLLVVVLLTAAIPITSSEVSATDLPELEEPGLLPDEGEALGLSLGEEGDGREDPPLLPTLADLGQSPGAEGGPEETGPPDDLGQMEETEGSALPSQASGLSGMEEGGLPLRGGEPANRPGMGQEEGIDKGSGDLLDDDSGGTGGGGMSIHDNDGYMVIEKVLEGEDSQKDFNFVISKLVFDPLEQASQGSDNSLGFGTGRIPPIGEDGGLVRLYEEVCDVSVKAGEASAPIELPRGTYKIEEQDVEGYQVTYRMGGQEGLRPRSAPGGVIDDLKIQAKETTQVIVTNTKTIDPGQLSVKQTFLGGEDPGQIRHYTLELELAIEPLLPGRQSIGREELIPSRLPLPGDEQQGKNPTEIRKALTPFILKGDQTWVSGDIKEGTPFSILPSDDSNLKEIRCNGQVVDKAQGEMVLGQSLTFEFIYETPSKLAQASQETDDSLGGDKILGNSDVKDVKVIATGEGKPFLLAGSCLTFLALCLAWLGRRGLVKKKVV